MTSPSIIPLVNSGLQDHELEALYQAVRNRKDRLQELNDAKLRSTLAVGDTVWFNDKTRPTYLQGHRCTIVEINRVRVVVELVNPVGRFGRGRITTQVDIITNIKPKYAVD